MKGKIILGLAGLLLLGQVDKSFLSERQLLAGMTYYEARNCSDAEKLQVASTAVNRARDNDSGNGTDLRSALTARGQYHGLSGWFKGLRILKLSASGDPVFEKCYKIGESAIKNPVSGRYFHLKGPTRTWTRDLTPKSNPRDFKMQYYL